MSQMLKSIEMMTAAYLEMAKDEKMTLQAINM
jgi:hypothetical protein